MWLPRRAFTLIDTIVAIGLMMLGSTLMITFFVYAVRLNQRLDGRQFLVLQAEKSVTRILSQFSPSRADLLRTDTSIAGIVFPRASAVNSNTLTFDSQGALIWSSWMAYGWDSPTQQLWEASRALVKPVTQGGELTSGLCPSPRVGRRGASWPSRCANFR